MRVSIVVAAALAMAIAACADTNGGGSTGSGAKVAPGAAANRPPLELTATIPLPGVKGRIDHLALDTKRRRLYVAALGNGSLEVVSLEKGERVRSVGPLPEPQGVAYLDEFDRVAVACGGDGTVRWYDGERTEPAGTVDLGDDADNVRYDAAAKRLWVAFGDGGLAAIDPTSMKETGRAPLDAHPEGFALESPGRRVFVNVAAKGEVAVVDRITLETTARWKLGAATSNFPIALDAVTKRLYVGCRSPSRLLVLSTENGEVVSTETCTDDPDDVLLDIERRRAYVVCGGGAIDVFDLSAAAPSPRANVATERGARTALLDEATGAIYVAVPRRGTNDAEIRIFEPR